MPDFFSDLESKIPRGEVRTRFAPSPTGYMHVGGVRTALYAYLLAKRNGGKFLLRIEDTDQNRYVEGATEIIYSSMKKAGLYWDEGPDIGGPVGPYIQSQRRGIYKKYAEKLVELGGAYYDEDGSGAVRQRMPREGSTTFHDDIFGDITVQNDSPSMNEGVLLKSDGLPTYNFANVIDDHLMGITHVVRGSEYLSSDAKYDLLYQCFGWEIPHYVTVSPVMRDASHKLSKREGDSTFEDLMNEGYLPEAIVNYVALCGWSPGGEREFFTLAELIDAFDTKGISKSPSIFDKVKLRYFNAEYIRGLEPETFFKFSEPYLRQSLDAKIDIRAVSDLIQSRTETLGDIPDSVRFFKNMPDYDAELYEHKKSRVDKTTSLDSLEKCLPALERQSDWSRDALYETQVRLAEELGVKNSVIMYPLRIAVSGKAVTPGGAAEIAAILGRDETLKRIKDAVNKLKSQQIP